MQKIQWSFGSVVISLSVIPGGLLIIVLINVGRWLETAGSMNRSLHVGYIGVLGGAGCLGSPRSVVRVTRQGKLIEQIVHFNIIVEWSLSVIYSYFLEYIHI